MKKLLLSLVLVFIWIPLMAAIQQNYFTTNQFTGGPLSTNFHKAFTGVPSSWTNLTGTGVNIQNVTASLSVVGVVGQAGIKFGVVGVSPTNEVYINTSLATTAHNEVVAIPTFYVPTNGIAFFVADSNGGGNNSDVAFGSGEIVSAGGVGPAGPSTLAQNITGNAATATVATNSPFVLSPIQFGAIGNGIVDDTIAFLNCLTVANTGALRRIDGYAKTYRINSPLILSNRNMELFNCTIVTTNKNLTNLIWVMNDCTKLHDLSLGGPGTNFYIATGLGSIGVHAEAPGTYLNQFTLEDSSVTNFTSCVFVGVSAETKIEHCLISGAYSNCVYLYGNDESKVENNQLGSCDTVPRDFQGAGTSTPFGLTNCVALRVASGLGATIVHNDIGYCGVAIICDGLGSPSQTRSTIDHNNIEAMFASNVPWLTITNSSAEIANNIFNGSLLSGVTNRAIGIYNVQNPSKVLIGPNAYDGFVSNGLPTTASAPIDVYEFGFSSYSSLPLATGWGSDNDFGARLILYHATWNDAGVFYPATLPNWGALPVIAGVPTFSGVVNIMGTLNESNQIAFQAEGIFSGMNVGGNSGGSIPAIYSYGNTLNIQNGSGSPVVIQSSGFGDNFTFPDAGGFSSSGGALVCDKSGNLSARSLTLVLTNISATATNSIASAKIWIQITNNGVAYKIPAFQ